MAEAVRRLIAGYARSQAHARAYREQVRADVDYFAAHPDSTGRAHQPVYRGWFLSAATVEFVIDDT